MFTGLVEEIGHVVERELLADDASILTLSTTTVLHGVGLGDSVSVNGACLTVVKIDGDTFSADVMAETNKRTSLGHLRLGDPVNLERAVLAHSRLGGHIVQGHVDGVGKLLSINPTEHWTTITFGLPDSLSRYVAEKGSIAVNGVSLTVSAVSDPGLGGEAVDGAFVEGQRTDGQWFSVSLIPTTLKDTTLGTANVGDPVNLEVDVIAKYVERLTTVGQA